MNFFSIILNTSVLLAIMPFNAHAVWGGGVTGGDGGQGVICGPVDEPFDAETVDLYEARRIYKFTPFYVDDFDNDGEDYLRHAVQEAQTRVRNVTGQNVNMDEVFKLALAHVSFAFMGQISSDPGLTNDLGNLLLPLPKGCSISEFAKFYYEPNGASNIIFSDTAYNYMESVDLAALLIHEAAHIYFPDQPSNLAIRQFVTFTAAPSDFRKRNAKAFIKLISTKQARNPQELH